MSTRPVCTDPHAAIDRVLALHHRNLVRVVVTERQMDGTEKVLSVEAECSHCRTPWPCITIRAIEGSLP